ncbi:hypothetical protein R3P38DRAFT_3244480 [Favolaschia claudopus]|uniref:Uncharacterized protein n=1 Tax=Favolaschia claudopus TaxID=2862362 RepID=A0AAV9Z210_9AGAR
MIAFSRCGGTPNTSNPFSFNLTSDTNFLRGYVQVYRKEEVRVPAALYDLYQSRGLLDPNHTIGTPYTSPWVATDKQYKLLAPYAFKDVTKAGYATTLGPASFREPMRNKLSPSCVAEKEEGRKRYVSVRTGERGRPRKPLTLATVKRIANIPRSAKRVKVDKENIDPVDQEDEEEEELAPTRRYNTRSRMP